MRRVSGPVVFIMLAGATVVTGSQRVTVAARPLSRGVAAALGWNGEMGDGATTRPQYSSQDQSGSAAPLVSGSVMGDTTPRDIDEQLPADVPALLDILRTRQQETSARLDSGQLPMMYVPALQTKGVALALEGHLDGLSPAKEVKARLAIKRIVVTAWQLDEAGDLGNMERARAIYEGFVKAVDDLEQAYAAVDQ